MVRQIALACVLACMLALSACTTTPVPLENPRAVWCENNEPRRDATPDTPRAEIDQINIHNAKGMLWCGWKP